MTLAREVLESDVVRAAEAVLEANDAMLLTRLVELVRLALEPATPMTAARPRG